MTTPPSSRPVYTLTQAASLVGVSRSTIRRRRENGDFPNAYKTRDGQWMVPLEDLLANQLRPLSSEHVHLEQVGSASSPTTLTGLDQAAQQQAQAEQAHLRERLQQAEHELALERARNDGLAQTLNAERTRANELSMALRMLEAGKAQAPATEPSKEPIAMPSKAQGNEPASEQEPRRRGFWAWFTGE